MHNEPKALVPEGAPCEDKVNRKIEAITNMIAVMTAYAEGNKIEIRRKNGIGDWELVHDPLWNWSDFEYRVKPIEGLPVINWSNVPKIYNYFAVDHNGDEYFYQICPTATDINWIEGGKHVLVYGISYSCHWTDSLVKRPN